MPSYVQRVKIMSTSPGATINNGDAFMIVPTSNTKNYFGSGAVDTGDFVATFNLDSSTNVEDADIIDGSIIKDKSGT